MDQREILLMKYCFACSAGKKFGSSPFLLAFKAYFKGLF